MHILRVKRLNTSLHGLSQVALKLFTIRLWRLQKEEFLQTLIDLHSTIFGISPEQAKESAQWRLLAATTVDLITSHTSSNVEGDWKQLEEYLRLCYRSIQQEIDKQYAQKPMQTS